MYRVFLAGRDAQERKAMRGALACAADRYEVTGEATDGEFALPMIADLRPDVLVAGEGMPFMDGMELARLVHREFPWIEIVLLGSSDKAAHGVEAEKAGVGEYLLRPVSAYELREAVERASCRLQQTAQTLEGSIRRAERSVTPKRRAREREMQCWLENGEGDPGASWPREGRYCRLLTLTGVSGREMEAVRGILRLMEAERGDRRAFALELSRGPTMVVAGDDEVQLENLAYEAAYSALSVVEKFAHARVKIQIGRCVDNIGALRDTWLDMQKLAQVQREDHPILSEDDLQPPVERMREYMDANLMDPGLIHGRMARDMGMNLRRFRVVFAQEMGMTFTDYAFIRRVEAAKDMLKNTRMRVSSVSQAVGFEDVSYFSCIFELVAGVTPQKYRKDNM